MKLLYPLGGLLVFAGSSLMHMLYSVTYIFLLVYRSFYPDTSDSWVTYYLNSWQVILPHLCIIIASVLKLVYQDSKYCKGFFLSLLFITLIYYWIMILVITDGHIRNLLSKKLNFFFVENYLHFIIFSEIVVFFTVFAMNIVVLFFASCFSAKKLRNSKFFATNYSQPRYVTNIQNNYYNSMG